MQNNQNKLNVLLLASHSSFLTVNTSFLTLNTFKITVCSLFVFHIFVLS